MSYSIKAKLMIAVTSATVLGMSAFIQPAEAAKKQGETYSQPSENEFKVEAQFSLVNQTRSGQPIVDQPVEREGAVVGRRFFEAIENYTEGTKSNDNSIVFGILCNIDNKNDTCTTNGSLKSEYYGGYYYLDINNFPIFQTPFVANEASRFDGDIVAEFLGAEELKKGYKPLFINANEEIEEWQKFFAETTNQTDVIVYSILKSGEDKSEFSYLLKLGDIPKNDRCQKIDDIKNKDKCSYVNDLEFILNNSLLSKAVPVRSIKTPGLSSNQARALIQNKFEQEVPVATVPEPSITLGALAAVGAGSLLKRKTKQS
ncbi:MAG TPA: hypothetical protein DCY88_27870 [Cyanobacteria bacterium UBA11372]|nr:hypothetical protein [Cyanobacteria bacterium UBA11372]